MSVRKLIALAACAVLLHVPHIARAAPAADSTATRLPEARVRVWQLGLMRPDRIQHLSLAFTAGTMIGLASEEPAAAAVGAFTLGIAKELWDARRGHFDMVDLLAGTSGAALSAGATITLTR